MSKITKIWAREILDSRGIPTVEIAAWTESGFVNVSSVPGGTSTGTHEALELRDNDKERFNGMGVLKAIENINNVLGPAICGMDSADQSGVDRKLIELDGTENKTKFGANSLLAISEVVSKCGANDQKMPLYLWVNVLFQKLGAKYQAKIPIPLFNMINGGRHGAGNLDFQEFHCIPSSAKRFRDSLQMAAEVYQSIKANLIRRGAVHSVGDEGGFAPNLFTNADALELFVQAVKETKYMMGRDLSLGLDIAANSFYKDGEYVIRDKSSPLDDNQLLEYYKGINSLYHLALIEDPFFEDGWGSWQKATTELGSQMVIVGDDLLATNPKRLQKAIAEKSCNALLAKPNQIGTVSETLGVIKLARDANWKVVVSHRSGETNDTFIADFAVGVGADYLKSGAPARGERVAKYNRLLAIEDEVTVRKTNA